MTKSIVVQAQQKWEYRTLTRKTEAPFVTELNVLGQQGWELVSVEYYKDMKGLMEWIGFLKRPASRPAAGQTASTNVGVASLLEPSKRLEPTSSLAQGFDLSEDDFKLEAE